MDVWQNYRRGPVFGIQVGIDQLDFEWEDPEEYLAPTRVTPLETRLEDKTSCAHIVLIAACLVIAFRRLASVAESRQCLFMAEALLCYQADPAYIRSKFQSTFPASRNRAQDAARLLCIKSTPVFRSDPGKHSGYPPTQPTKNVVALTNHILRASDRGAFERWLGHALQRLSSIAPAPRSDLGTREDYGNDDEWKEANQQRFGLPLPIESVNLGAAAVASELGTQYSEFIANVDWNTNSYLESPETMLERGFHGLPYSWPR